MTQELSAEEIVIEGDGSFQPPPHVLDGECWCKPFVEYVHPDEDEQEN